MWSYSLTNEQFRVQEVHGFVFPGVFIPQVNAMTDIFDTNAVSNCEKYCILEAKDKLHGGTECHRGVVRVAHQQKVYGAQED